MQLFVRSLTSYSLEISEDLSVLDLKNRIAAAEGVEVDEFALSHAGSPLEDGKQLGEFVNLASIDVEFRLLGGKVHGSLARAGKVKGQTPKVEKQEKKKPKTGRAKRRQQYNRRFVSVVATFGRKKGPNSNS